MLSMAGKQGKQKEGATKEMTVHGKGQRAYSRERSQLSLPSDDARKTSHKALTEHDSSNCLYKTNSAMLLEHFMCECTQRRDRKREEGSGWLYTGAGAVKPPPDGTGSVWCFICLAKKADLSLNSFRQGFFSLFWKCLTVPGCFLTVTHEIKIFISCSGIARTPLFRFCWNRRPVMMGRAGSLCRLTWEIVCWALPLR